MRNRATRRAKKEALKQKSLKLFGHVKHADHLRVCSCAACGNPRKWFGEKTLAEKKALGQ